MGNEPSKEELELSNWVDGEPKTYKEILASDNRLVVSLAEAAELLSISYETAREYTRRGFIFAPDTYGGRVLVTKASIERFLTEGPPKPEPKPISPEPCVPPPPARRRSTEPAFNLDAFRRDPKTRRKTG